MPDVAALSQHSFAAHSYTPKSYTDMSAGDTSFEKFFEEVIASPELNLLDDVFCEEDVDQKPSIVHHPYQHMPLPILHRLQPVAPAPISILKAHAHANQIVPAPSLSTGSGGISPTLTWSGDPSPIDQDNSPTLIDMADLDGEEWRPSLSAAVPSLFETTPATSGRGRRASAAQSGSGSRSRSSKRASSSSNSADGGDELTMSNLSIKNGTTSLAALLSSPPSPGAAAHTPRASSGGRKKSRTTSSSRSSVSSIDALISEAMGAKDGSNGRPLPTGHRRNITSASLVPLDAPTQIRNYLTPSSTSKKDIPSAFVARRNKLKAREAHSPSKSTSPVASTSRKRSREEAGLQADEADEDQDELNDDGTVDGSTPLPSQDPTSPSTSPSSPTNTTAPGGSELASESSSLLSAIEAKRRQNTLAARRSRQRKLDYVRGLEELVHALTRERDNWKGRAESAEKVLGYRPGEDEMDDEE